MFSPAIPHRQAVSNRRSVLVFASLSVLALLPACGSSGPEMARVSGKVTYQGKPVTEGIVSFVPVDPNGTIATSRIDEQGNYSLQTHELGEGALLGQYRVSISGRDEDKVLDYIPAKPVKIETQVPLKYENPDTSELTREVKSGSNTYDFDLK